MALTKTVNIDGNDVTFRASAAIPRIYRNKFHRDIYKDLTVQRLNELYSTNGQVGFVATERVDGKVILPEGIKLLKMKA